MSQIFKFGVDFHRTCILQSIYLYRWWSKQVEHHTYNALSVFHGFYNLYDYKIERVIWSFLLLYSSSIQEDASICKWSWLENLFRWKIILNTIYFGLPCEVFFVNYICSIHSIRSFIEHSYMFPFEPKLEQEPELKPVIQTKDVHELETEPKAEYTAKSKANLIKI